MMPNQELAELIAADPYCAQGGKAARVSAIMTHLEFARPVYSRRKLESDNGFLRSFLAGLKDELNNSASFQQWAPDAIDGALRMTRYPAPSPKTAE